jgi:hypothetical protein
MCNDVVDIVVSHSANIPFPHSLTSLLTSVVDKNEEAFKERAKKMSGDIVGLGTPMKLITYHYHY